MKSKFTPITVEKEPLQRTAANAERLDLNNNLSSSLLNNLSRNPPNNLPNNLANNPLKSDELKDLEKYEKIRELIIKNERLREFIEKIGKLQHTMSSFHKLNEINKLITDLSANQLELKNECLLLAKQVGQLNELNTRQDQLIAERAEQERLLERADLVNRQFRQLVTEYKEQNAELKQNHERLVADLTQKLAQI